MALPALAIQALQNRPKIKMSRTLINVLLATGLGFGVFFGIRAVVLNTKRDLRQRGALDAGNPANFATQLKMAFENDNSFGWGTDEQAVFRILDSIPSASMMRKVQRAYRDLHSQNLAIDLKDELNSEEYAIALEIINTKS